MENPFELLAAKIDGLEKLINELNAKVGLLTVDKEPVNDFLNKDEVARLLGLRKSTVSKYVMDRKIPFYKTGKQVLFKKAEITEFIEKNRHKSLDETQAEASGYRPFKKRSR